MASSSDHESYLPELTKYNDSETDTRPIRAEQHKEEPVSTDSDSPDSESDQSKQSDQVINKRECQKCGHMFKLPRNVRQHWREACPYNPDCIGSQPKKPKSDPSETTSQVNKRKPKKAKKVKPTNAEPTSSESDAKKRPIKKPKPSARRLVTVPSKASTVIISDGAVS